MFLYLNYVFSRTPSSLRLLLMIPLFSWLTNSGKIFTGKGLKVERQLCMLEIGIRMLRWRPDISAFTDGFSKLIDDISLDTRSTMLFTSVGYKTFESKHKEKHETNESHVEQDLSGDSDTEDSKFDRYIAAQIEMEDAKNLFKDGWNTMNDALKNTPSATSQCDFDTKGKSKVVCGDETVSSKVYIVIIVISI
ncbi:hypothetical protein Hdeb2414_s0005g00172031 [Helianthus debilis subsp. tardiflorus]